jgi:lysophospholipase L1-like esterase
MSVRLFCAIIMMLFALGPGAASLHADSSNDFQWSGLGSNEDKAITAETVDGKQVIRLTRKKPGAEVHIERNVMLKPQTLYRFSVTGIGGARAAMRLRPASSADKEFASLYKPWATSSAPMPVSDNPVASELIFDSGLKADSAVLSVYLDGKAPGQYVVQQALFAEIGSSKPKADEKIILHLGDSITITSYLPFEQRVEARLQKHFPSFPNSPVRQINYGVDGEYVKELLDSDRYRKVVKENLPRVDIVVIRYGANDSRHGTPEDFKTQLATLCDKVQKDYPTARIVLGTGTCLHGNKDVNRKYGPYWQAIRDLASERKYPLVDVYKAFEQAQSEKLCRGPGDMHPSAAGVELIADKTLSVLRELLK